MSKRADTFRTFLTGIAGFFAILAPVGLEAATLGASVDNVATISYEIGGSSFALVTPPATFVIQARPTPSTIDFFRVAPAAPDAISVRLSGSDYATDGVAAFAAVGAIAMAGGAAIDLAAPVKLVPTSDYYAGEPIIARVIDAGQNGDPAVIETIVATIVSAAGDSVVLRFYESGPDSGEFFAYIQSSGGASPANDALLAVAQGLDLTATYVDPFDATEVSTAVAGVDPFGVVFDSTTGARLDGVTVRIVDDATGLPANVFGVDGLSAFPSTIVTGSTVVDAGGFVYALAPGEFRFPIMFPGRYRIEVTPPPGYSAPSVATAAAIAALPGGPYVITPASYLQPFDLAGTGDIRFDAPLDPQTDVLVAKTASAAAASVGDFVRYEISAENRGDAPVSIVMRDRLPQGVRYRPGSARINGAAVADPTISPDGATLVFAAGLAAPGETLILAYVAEISAATPAGEAVNRAEAINGLGASVSNTAEAAVLVEDDLIRSTLTIAGRVAEDACDPEAKWPRRPSRGKGVAGVRLYMETGAYVVTDARGLYHFEDVDARTHVVQLDLSTLPAGYEAVSCEANTRFAGAAASQFVDAQGGALWRANFYLRRKPGAAPDAPAPSSETPLAEPYNDATEYRKFDKAWLEWQSPDAAFVYPEESRTPSARAVNLGVKHPGGSTAKLFVNGAPAGALNFAGRDVSSGGGAALTHWRGVDIGDGETRVTAKIYGADGNEIAALERRFVYVDRVMRATLVPEGSRLVADGKTPSVVAVRIADEAGRPVHGGRQIKVKIDPPFRARAAVAVENALPLTAPLASESAATVGPDGVARIELDPTAETGRLRLRIVLDDGREAEITAFIRPVLRDWIVVGLAEGKGGLEKSSGALPSGRELVGDGRIAVFAKGAVKGGWLITAAGDTAKKRGREDDELFDAIDPDDRYPIYGDKTNQEFEAQSRYPVFLKAEKDGFQALIGDFDTGLNQTELGRYARRMTGARVLYEGRNYSFTGFAAETNQDFVRDEIAADGTSGPYRASGAPIVRNSETIVVEARDRFRPDIVRSATPLLRYLDYDIDFSSGEILFRLPIAAADSPESENVIVVEYETSAPVARNLTAGGRLARRLMGGRAEIGVTGLHEDGRDGLREGGDLGAVDVRYDLTPTTQARLEYGLTRRETATGRETADAFIAELKHVSDRLRADAYYRETDAAYGLRQQSSAVTGVRRFGAELSYRFQRFIGAKSGAQTSRYADAKAYREENLETGASRSVAEVALRQENAATAGAVGLKGVVEAPAAGLRRRALLSTLSFRHGFEKLGLTLRASRDQPIASEGESTFFPKRTILGFDQRLFDKATLSVSHEIEDRDQGSNSKTIVGVVAEPWSGARLSAAGDVASAESGRRLGATFGVDQRVRISKDWTGSLGMSRRETFGADGVVAPADDIVPDDPVSPIAAGERFTSLYVGAGYQSGATTGSARFEHRKSDASRRYTALLGAARQLGNSLSFAGAARYSQDNNELEPDRRSLDARFGAAYRPDASDGLIILNRFDVKIDNTDGAFNSWKAINNLAVNLQPYERIQVSLNHGLKYAVLDDGFLKYSGFTELFGVETRFDVTRTIDVGFRGLALYTHGSGVLDYAFGPSVGFNPANNIWFGFGWNFSGIKDEDFVAADYAQKGPYLQLRMKFDQTTAKGLLDLISPGAAP